MTDRTAADGTRAAQATIEQVAARAGVSRSTVSRVLGGGSRVSPAALDAVHEAIEELSYVPNRAARSLATKQTHAIALVVPEDTTRFFGDPFFAAIVSGINARLSTTDHVLNLFIASDDVGDKTTRYLRAGNVDGAIVVSHHTSDSYIDRIAEAVPLVFGGRPVVSRSDDYYIDVDNVAGGRGATTHLISRGARRIAMIAGPRDMPAGIDRLEGFRSAIAAAGLEPGPVVEGDFTLAGGGDAARRLLALGEDFDALFVASDLMARGTIGVFREAGLRVPDDLKLIGFDDSPMATSATPHLTTVRQPSHLQGVTMTDVLLARLRGEDPPRVTTLPTELVVRDST
ncbi:LacI family DNA-binding transcriptional regulator [Microbacterium halotolerans]|uniref:LacI family DNA-binding transcriptional regulator n=1 Tax=Microbacterium halotolerans TaxID=246613 RepID=UPI001F0920AA|nr:LacI family DNA-binding transcriptional regulator [Microbacterium halotolerans]